MSDKAKTMPSILRKAGRWRVIEVGCIIVLVTFVCIISCQLVVSQCILGDCAPSRDFKLVVINIPKEFYPAYADMAPLSQFRTYFPEVESVQGGTYWGEYRAIFSIKRFGSYNTAGWYFGKDRSINWFTQPFDANEPLDSVLAFQGEFADQSSTICGYILSDLTCIYLARYKELYVFYQSSIDSQGMPPEQYLKVLEYIDNELNTLLTVR